MAGNFFEGRKLYMKVKHGILARCLGGWGPVLSSSDSVDRLVYIDGFAGPGKYDDGSDGSPLRALKLLRHHKLSDRFKAVTMVFVEYNRQTLEALKREVDKIVSIQTANNDEMPPFVSFMENLKTEFQHFLRKYKVELKRSAVFTFVDPFGYSTAPMNVIQQLVQCSPKAEVMVNVMSSYMNRSKDVLERRVSLEKALGRRMEEEEYGNWARGEGVEEIADVYAEELRRRGATYTVQFGMCASKTGVGGITYHLVFASKHKKGRQMMKDAMFKFALSAPRKRNGQPFDALYYCEAKKGTIDDDTRKKIATAYLYIRKEVMREFRGKTATLAEVKEFIWSSKQFPFRKATIKSLVEDGSIKWYQKNGEGLS
eukprot:m.269472 g.269472  ORF g.269472 m.269472 type:complete len:370 (+) comp40539_c1_seq1:357-1466(+)